MQKKLAIVVLIVLAVACLLTACNNKTVTNVELVDFSTEIMQNDAVEYDSVKAKVTFDDGTTETKTLKEWRTQLGISWTTLDTSKVGNASFKIIVGAKEYPISATIVAAYVDEGSRVAAFEQPDFVSNYKRKSTTPEGETDGWKDGNFRVLEQVYEVGTANPFVLEPKLSALNSNMTPVRQDVDVPTVVSVKMGSSATSLADVAEENVSSIFTKDGNAYSFSDDVDGKYVELTISLDNANDYFIVPDDIETTFTLLVKVVADGYNVYDQLGLSVMNDAAKIEMWADIWGITVDANGNVVGDSNAVKAGKDPQPLYKYVGNVSSVILHGDIVLDADQLPAAFFWLDESDATFQSVKQIISETTPSDKNMADQLKGSLNDGYVDVRVDGTAEHYLVSNLEYIQNVNKGLYQTTKVNISGNYCTIEVPSTRSAGGRILKSVITSATMKAEQPYVGWNIFKLFEADTRAEGEYILDATTSYSIKNVGMFGNAPKTEDVGPQGIGMFNLFAKSMSISNVVGQAFFSNVVVDNYGGGSNVVCMINVDGCKFTNSYNAMMVTWRNNISVSNSVMRDAGGPIFILNDGDGRETGDLEGIPSLTIDENSQLQSYAQGTESWYGQLGSEVPALFSVAQSINPHLQALTQKSFVTTNDAGDGYINVIAVVIPEPGSALEANNSDHQEYTQGKVVNGLFQRTTSAGTEILFDTSPTDYESQEQLMLQMNTSLFSLLELQRLSLATAPFSTVSIQSGGNLAVVTGQDSQGATGIASPYGALTWLSMTAEQQGQYVAAYGEEGVQNLLAPSDWLVNWATTSNEFVTFSLQAKTGNIKSPFLSIIVGDFSPVGTQV